MQGCSDARCGFTHSSSKQSLSNIFQFYSSENEKPIHEYAEAYKLLGLDVRKKPTLYCPLIYPNGDVIGRPHCMLQSEYILQVSLGQC